MNEHLIYLEQLLSKILVWWSILVVILLGAILISMLLTPVNMKEQHANFKASLKKSASKVYPYVLAGAALGVFVTILGT